MIPFLLKGPIAESILARIRDTGGIMTQDDLSNFEVKVQPALEGTYRGRKIYTTHAPTSGPVLLHMLNLLEKYEDFAADGRTSLNVHRLIEIIKCKYKYNVFSEKDAQIRIMKSGSLQGSESWFSLFTRLISFEEPR